MSQAEVLVCRMVQEALKKVLHTEQHSLLYGRLSIMKLVVRSARYEVQGSRGSCRAIRAKSAFVVSSRSS